MQVHVGTSGWNYDHWRGSFYPEKGSKAAWLEYYTAIFETVELNATFYRSLRPIVFTHWYHRTPAGFIWAVKANRFITHIRRLHDAAEPLTRFCDSLIPLKEKLGPVLLQLPPGLGFDPGAAEAFCQLLPKTLRFTMEARHGSWFSDSALEMLQRYRIAWCISDTAGRYPYREAVTTDFVYVRLHGSQVLYASNYSEEELQQWADKISVWNQETFVYFDNDAMAYAPRNALRLREILTTR